ncbi:MAG: DNA topoisomerase IV subunit A [Bacilli bacterium]
MKKEKTIVEKVYEYSLEEIMGERFGRYSKYIIQDRALPDARDGLKPVQRRILFSMYKDRNTYDRETKKSAKTVGNVIGNYHPHGDTSVYDAMVRLSQKWKQRELLVEIQGNNGSIDGDGPAAMRYTEARLTKISNVLLKDLEKNTVDMAPTFDDDQEEPTVLPANFPNLLVNGASGISAGYATNIPAHNLEEVINATIKRIDKPDCSFETITNIIKGPDFSTGGIIEGKSEILKAYKTGRGKIVVKSKFEIVKNKGNEQIIITEIPYDTLKCNIIKKIEEIRINKKIDGIVEVRDESDKNDELRIALDLKKGANAILITNYLLKNTDMQVTYSFNMVAIVNKRPKYLGILEALDAFIEHKKQVVHKRTKFDLDHASARLHIIEGFIRAMDILDEIVALIRKSKDKSDAINNLVDTYDFTRIQAEAIVMMQLYKLTNTDVTILREEYDKLCILIKELTHILNDEEALKEVMKNELIEVRNEFKTKRRSIINDEITSIEIDELDMISKDDYIVCISKAGYIKKVTLKSYNAYEKESTGLKEGDYLESIYKLNNVNTVVLFTSLGNYLYVPLRNLNETKYKDVGDFIGSIVSISDNEKIIKSMPLVNENNSYITIFTKLGMVKRIYQKDLIVQRYSKAIMCIKLKEGDEVVSVSDNMGDQVLSVSKNGYAIKFSTQEIPIVGLRTSGVKLMNLKDDAVVSAFVIDILKDYATIFTDKNTCKRVKIIDILKTTRAKKGSLLIKSPKSKKYYIKNVINSSSKSICNIVSDEINELKASDTVISDLLSVGSLYTKKDVINIIEKPVLLTITSKEENIINDDKVKEENPVLKETKINDNLTMSDFFDEFKL